MEQEQIPIEVKYVSLEPTEAERLKVEKIINEQPGNWAETFAGLPTDLQERIRIDPEYCPTDAVLDASLQNHGYGLPPEVRSRMYEDFARFLSDCGIPQDAPDYPYTPLAKQFLDNRIETPMIISPVEPEEPPHPDTPFPAEPEIDIWGEAGEPAPESPPGITHPEELQQVQEKPPESADKDPETKEQGEAVTGIGSSLYPEDTDYSYDSVVIKDDFAGKPDQLFIGVYNGIASPQAAQMAAERLHQNLLTSLTAGKEPAEALKEAYLNTDSEILEKSGEFDYGATAVTAFIKGDNLFVANTGNSRAILCREGVPVRLSSDHTTNLQVEKDRVAALGGSENARSAIPVGHPKEGGIYAVTHVLGNPGYKRFTTAEPSISQTQLQPGDNFLILANRRVWEMMDDQEAVDLIKNEPDPQKASELLKKEVFTRLTALVSRLRSPLDDISVVVVRLPTVTPQPLATKEVKPMVGAEAAPEPQIKRAKEPATDETIPGILAEERREPRIFVLPDGRRIEAKLLTTVGAFAYIYTGRYEGESEDSVIIKVGAIKEEEIRRASMIAGHKEAYIWAPQEICKKFENEAEILRDLENKGTTHVPKLHYYRPGLEEDFDNNPPYIVMDLAKGFPIDFFSHGEHIRYELGGKIVGRGFEETTVLEIINQMVDAMDSTLKAGYYNKDIKMVAENFLWDPQSRNLMFIDWNEADLISRTRYDPAWIQRRYLEKTRNALQHLLIGGIGIEYFFKGRVRQELPDVFDRLADLEVVSAGTRNILKKAFAVKNTYPDLLALRADLEKQLAVLGGLGTPEPAR